MESPTALQWIAAVGAILTPILLAVLSALGWMIKQRVDASRERELQALERASRLETDLREDRLAVYMEILQPFVLVFTKDQGFAGDKTYRGKSKDQVVLELMLSVPYRQAAFRMSLFASDDVLTAYNRLMQFFYARDEASKSTPEETLEMMHLFGEFLLAIRRSVGNEDTAVDAFGMLEWLIKDIAAYRALHAST